MQSDDNYIAAKTANINFKLFKLSYFQTLVRPNIHDLGLLTATLRISTVDTVSANKRVKVGLLINDRTAMVF